MSMLITTPEANMRVDNANEICDRGVAEQIERKDNREGTKQGETNNDDHVVSGDPPTPASFELCVPLASGAGEPVGPVSSVRVEPSASSGATVARPNSVDEHRDEHVESSAPAEGSVPDAVDYFGMDVDMVDGGDDAFQNVFAIWTDLQNCEYCEITWWPWRCPQKRTLECASCRCQRVVLAAACVSGRQIDAPISMHPRVRILFYDGRP